MKKQDTERHFTEIERRIAAYSDLDSCPACRIPANRVSLEWDRTTKRIKAHWFCTECRGTGTVWLNAQPAG
jgi:hypothetical protein